MHGVALRRRISRPAVARAVGIVLAVALAGITPFFWILDAMNARTRLSVEEIARRSGLSPGRVRSLLGLLQLEGDVELDGASWHRASSPRNR